MSSPHPFRSVAAVGALALLSVTAALPAVAKNDKVPAPPGQSVTIDIASITDFHGQVVATSSTGGAAGVSGVVEALRAANRNTIFVANGDSFGGSAFESAVLEDRPTAELLNAMGLFVSNTGNHEFDKGWADLRDRIMPMTDFDFLGANIQGAAGLKPYQIWSLPGTAGLRVAFVGTLTQDLPNLVSPGGIQGITVTGICAALNTYAGQLSDGRANNGEADIVIALSHEGHAIVDDCTFSKDVDAVLTGHSHSKFVGTVTRADGVAIPMIEGVNAGGTVAHLSFTFSRATRTLTYGVAENISTTGTIPGTTTPYVANASATVKEIIARTVAESAEAGKAVVGNASADLLRAQLGVSRGGESTIGNFLADVALWQLDQITGADFGVINPGGIRADLLAGEITYAEAFTAQPFGNTMASVTLTGAQVDLMLEQQWKDPTATHPVLRLGLSHNVEYVFDPAAPAGSRVSEIVVDGVPVDPAGTYRVAGNSFLLAGGDGFSVFPAGTGYRDTGIIDLASLLEYLRTHSPVAVDYTQGSTGLTLSGPLTAGATVTASISSLAFTNTEPKPATVDLFVNGTLVGDDLPVDNTVTHKTDETGRAAATFTVPAGVTPENAVVRIVTNDGTTDISF